MHSEEITEQKPGRGRRFVMFPLVRIIIGLIFVLGSIVLWQIGIKIIIDNFYGDEKLPLIGAILVFLSMTLLGILSYYLFIRWVERRSLKELSRPGAWKEFGIGSGIGFGLMSSVTVILWVSGYYQVSVSVRSLYYYVRFLTRSLQDSSKK